MREEATAWIKFIRQYGPIARNDNMFDETIQRAARRAKIAPLAFVHPVQDDLLACFDCAPHEMTSAILTGTAGDGKTHLCRQVWERLNGDVQLWQSNEPYIAHPFYLADGRAVTLHVLRDLSAWVPQKNMSWDPAKERLLQTFCQSIFTDQPLDFFLIAANDGQLVETWRRLPDAVAVQQARELIENLLVENRTQETDTRLKFFNLSRSRSAELFDRSLQAFLGHPAWALCFADNAGEDEAFGPCCPIRRNYEILSDERVQLRLHKLFALCDYNEFHLPIRQVLLLLANALLGHPDANSALMVPADIPGIIRARTVAKASVYNNIFGGNLSEAQRDSISVFDAMSRFRIGHETCNRVENILIFGEADQDLKPYFESLIGEDAFYGADVSFRAAQRDYVEGSDENEAAKTNAFLNHLVRQRRALFFKIPEHLEEELRLWDLTVFKYAGEYTERVVNVLHAGGRVGRNILARLVRGLNRIFVGMLVSSDRELFLATSLSFSHTRVSRLLEERVSVSPRLGERVDIVLCEGIPSLNVVLAENIHVPLRLNLTRYEFLCRVSDGALPGSFSTECNADMLAFKSQVLKALAERRRQFNEESLGSLSFRLLDLDDAGTPIENVVEVMDA